MLISTVLTTIVFCFSILAQAQITQINKSETLATSIIIDPFYRETKWQDNLSVKGSLRLRHQEDAKTNLLNTRNYTLLRARLDVGYKVNSKLSIFAQPQFAKTLGEPEYVATGSASNTRMDTSGNTNDTNLDLHQFYFDYNLNEILSIRAGRESLSYGDELVMGASNWGNIGRSFDLVKLIAQTAFWKADLFYSKLVDNNTSTTSTNDLNGDRDLYVGYFAARLNPYVNELDLYYLVRKENDLPSQRHLSAMGARAKSKHSFIDYRAEYTKQHGYRNAYQANIEIGASNSELSYKPRVALEYMLATEEYDGLYGTTHRYLGYADVLGRRNIFSYVAHLAANALDNLRLGLDYHWFYRHSENQPAYATNTTTALGSGTASNEKHIGTELDMTANYSVDPNTKLELGVGLFEPGPYLTDQYQDLDIYSYYLSLDIQF